MRIKLLKLCEERLMGNTYYLCTFVNKLLCLFNQNKHSRMFLIYLCPSLLSDQKLNHVSKHRSAALLLSIIKIQQG